MEQKLSSRDRVLVVGGLLFSVVALLIGWQLYPKVNRSASIRFDVDRAESETIANDLLVSLGLDHENHRHASRFVADREGMVFLERTLGLDQANELVTGPVRIWRWGHRWFQPLEKEEFELEIATTGEVVKFEHTIEENVSGERLSPEAARAVAERIAKETLQVELSRLEFVQAQSKDRRFRTDHTFIWRDPSLRWDGGEYRHELSIHGDQLGGYRQFVYQRESWVREYTELRSKNGALGAVGGGLLGLTLLAALVVFSRRIRLQDIRWRTAMIFAGIATVLSFLSYLNGFSTEIYEFDTTNSWGAFLVRGLLIGLVQSVVKGAVIFVVTAAGEALYRETYPKKISLTNFFTPAGMRTRRFFLAAITGIVMTAGLFLYQEVFYLIAGRMGAWAPSEIPYNELLNTKFPWVFVLLIGFLPAVTEEFLCRMFSISLLRKLTRRTWIAVLIPALIWGMAHAGYPNQPFYIRGIEVGLVGILAGVVFLRLNIGAVLFWHYTVDALLSGLLLLRSGNNYYVISAALAAGVLLLPLLYAVYSYVRRGGFESPEELLSGKELTPRPLEESPRNEQSWTAPPSWSATRRWRVTLAAFALCLTLWIPIHEILRPEAMTRSRAEAEDAARGVLTALGEHPDSFRVAVIGDSSYDETWARYLLQQGGHDALTTAIDQFDADFRWKARFFRPSEPQEFRFEFEGEEGGMIAFERRIAEDEKLSSLNSEAAERLAESYLRHRDHDLSDFVLKEASSENRPRRLDHTFLWEGRPDHPRHVGEAMYRIEVAVQGEQIASYREFLKLPEDWERDRETRTIWTGLRFVLMLVGQGFLIGLALWILLDGHRRGQTEWRRCLLLAAPFGILALMSNLNAFPQIAYQYDNQVSWNLYLVSSAVGIGVTTTFQYLFFTTCFATITTHLPQIWGLRQFEFRRALGTDALISALFALGLGLAVHRVVGLTAQFAPGIAVPPNVEFGASEATHWPWLDIVSGVWIEWVIWFTAGVAIYGGVRWWNEHKVGMSLVFLGAALSLVPLSTRGTFEFAAAGLQVVFWIGIVVGFARWIGRDNLLTYPVALFAVLSAHALSPYFLADGPYFQLQGWIAAALLALPLLWLVFALTTLEASGERQYVEGS